MFFVHNLHRSKLVVLVSLLSSNNNFKNWGVNNNLQNGLYNIIIFNLECQIYNNQAKDQTQETIIESQVLKDRTYV